MNDEATIPVTDIIDQMTEGHDFLLETVGARPTVGWHIGISPYIKTKYKIHLVTLHNNQQFSLEWGSMDFSLLE